MATIVVTTLSDTPVTGQLTLRQAINHAGAGDTIVFAASLHGTVNLTHNLQINSTVTIDGGGSGLGGNVGIGGEGVSVIVDGNVTLEHLSVVGGVAGAGGTPGQAGGTGSNGDPGQNGGDGDNGGKAKVAGFAGSPAIINEGTLTLDHVFVSGDSSGGPGGKGGDGGAGGVGGGPAGADPDGADGGGGGHGGLGSNGGSAVGAILNDGNLILKDSAIGFSTGDGGAGGAGGGGGSGGQGGTGNHGGGGGNGGDGGNGGSGGAGVGGILNRGSITVEGAAIFYGNSGVGGAGGLGGKLGSGGQGGQGQGNIFGPKGDDGASGKAGSTGSGIANFDGAGPSSGHFTAGPDFYDFGNVSVSGQSIGPSGFGGSSFTSVSEVIIRNGENVAGSVQWHVVGGNGITAADFSGGVLPSGTATFSDSFGQAGIGFSFASGFAPTHNETVQIQLTNPGNGAALGSGSLFTVQLFAVTANADTVNGTAGNDSIDGGAGNDTIRGNGGNDDLTGSAGNDVINGGAGDDVLYGGAGRDTLTGGAGADQFLYFLTESTPAAPDTIADFRHAQGDRIAIAGATKFVGTAAFDGHADEIRFAFDDAHNRTIVFYDSNGDKTADTEIFLTGHIALVKSDFGLSSPQAPHAAEPASVSQHDLDNFPFLNSMHTGLHDLLL